MNNIQVELLVDKKNIRWFQILAKLEVVSDISRSNLADALSITTRTITTDIKELSEHFNQAIIIDTNPKGYALKIINKIHYLEKKSELLSHEPILLLLSSIFHGEIHSIYEWSDQFYITDRTLSNYLKKLEPLLKRFHLKLNLPDIYLIGEEIDIRNFFLYVFYEDGAIPHYIFPPLIIQSIVNDFSHQNPKILPANIPYFKFSYLLFITYQRLLLNKPIIFHEPVFKILSGLKLFSVLEPLNELFRKHAAIQLNKNELAYLTLILLDYREQTDDYNNYALPNKLIPDALISFVDDFCVEQKISRDNFLGTDVKKFFYSHYLKASVSTSCLLFPSSLREKLMLNYPIRIDRVKSFLLNYKNSFWTPIIDDFTISVFLFIQALDYRIKDKNYVIAFLFEGSAEMCLLFEEIARHHIPKNHTVYFPHVDTFGKEYFENNEIDLIVTNFNEYIFDDFTYKENITVLLFNFIPTIDDWNTLIGYLQPSLSDKYKFSIK